MSCGCRDAAVLGDRSNSFRLPSGKLAQLVVQPVRFGSIANGRLVTVR
jgi:hypothetical protein